MRTVISFLLYRARQCLPVVLSAGLIFTAGCFVMAGEAVASPAGLVQLDWNTLATAWGPMAIILGWFMVREDRRDKRLYAMMEKCTDVMAKVNDRLAQSDAGDEKNRAATYRLADEIKDLRTEILALSGTTPTRNTRIMPKEE